MYLVEHTKEYFYQQIHLQTIPKSSQLRCYSVIYEINLVVNLPAKHAQHYTSAQWSTLASRLWIATAKPSPNRPTIIVKQFTENKCSLTVCYRLARSPHQTEPRVYDINIAFIDFRPNFQLCPYHASLLVHLCRPVPLSILFNRYRRQKINFQRLLLFPESSSSAKPTHATHDCYDLTLPCLLRSLSLPVVGKKCWNPLWTVWTPAPKTSADALLELLLYAGGQVDRWIRSSSKDTPTKDERFKDKDPKRGSPFRHGRASSCVSFTICR